MKIIKLSLVLSTIALFVFACSENKAANSNTTSIVVTNTNPATDSAPTVAPDELASAKQIYLNTCIKCHKEDGTGGETNIDGTKIKAPNFTSEKLKKEPDSEFIEIIKNGEKEEGMPAFKDRLSDEQIKNLVKLIRREFQKQ